MTNHPSHRSFPIPRGILIATLSFVALVLAGCGDDDAPKGGGRPAGPPVPVTLAPLRTAEVARSVDVVGTLYGEEDATISNKVNGKIVTVFRDVGDRVKPGDPLAQLLRNDYLLDANLKQAALNEVLAKLDLRQPPPKDYDVQNLPSVTQGRRGWENAERKFTIGQELFQSQPRPLISKQEYEDLKAARDVAKAAYDAEVLTAEALVGTARVRHAELRQALQALNDTTIRAPQETYRAPDVEIELPPDADGLSPTLAPQSLEPSTQPTTLPAAEARLESASATQPASSPTGDPVLASASPAELRTAAAPPATAPTTRPIDPKAAAMLARKTERSYVIAERYASEGELMRAVTPFFRLVDDDPLKLRAAVPERHFPELAIGQLVQVAVDAYPGTFDGVISRISPQVDRANRTFQAEILIPNADAARKLTPGAFARASIQTRVQKDVIFVPAEAVVSFAGVDKVYVVKDGKAKEIQITVGVRQEEPPAKPGGKPRAFVEVVSGLKGDEKVTVTGVNRLASGVPVEVK